MLNIQTEDCLSVDTVVHELEEMYNIMYDGFKKLNERLSSLENGMRGIKDRLIDIKQGISRVRFF